jgi:hypothetical protein
MHLDVLQIPLVRQRPFRGKNRIVLPPDDERRWLIRAEIGVPLRIAWRVGAIIVEQLELDGLVARAILKILVDDPIIGTDRLGGGFRYHTANHPFVMVV